MEKRSIKCQKCGECCRWSGHVLVDDADISRLATRLNLSEDAFIDRYTILAENRSQLSLCDGPDGACIFLSGTVCEVYDARPEQCRTFLSEWITRSGCPAARPDGQGRGA